MNLNTSIKGRALYLAIIISFIASSLAFLFLLSKYYRSTEVYDLNQYKQLSDDALSAINILMQDTNFISFDEQKITDLYGDSLHPVTVSKKQWGIYRIACAEAKRKHFTVRKIALFGQRNGGNKTGVYLADHGHYLTVAGNTYLSGSCFFPKMGVRKGYINGKSFKYRNIIDGTQNQSKEQLPILNSAFTYYLSNELFNDSNTDDSLVTENILSSEKNRNSFYEKTLRIVSEKSIVLDDVEITDNYIIQSRQKISITGNCRLKNVICVAPYISVESNFRGTVQLIASDSIHIDKNVVLQYPSAIVAAGIERSTSVIIIGSGSSISGSVIAFADIVADNNTSVKLESGSEVNGLVYCAGRAEHKGKVTGSFYCDRFFLQTPQGYYENHLLDATIDPIGLEPHFTTGGVFNEDPANLLNQIIAWLH